MGAGNTRIERVARVYGQREDPNGAKKRLNLRAKLKGGGHPEVPSPGPGAPCASPPERTGSNLDAALATRERDEGTLMNTDDGRCSNIFENTDLETFTPPQFLDPNYRRGDLMARRIMPVGVSVWDHYDNSGETLGTGLSGAVVGVINKLTGQRYAFKEFLFRGYSQKALNSLYNEIDLFLGMKHPHVAGLVEIFSDSEGFGMIMELCVGGNLVHYRLRNKATWTEALTKHLFFQMLVVVHAQHHNQIAIRDIKLDNFVVQINKRENENIPLEEAIRRLRTKLIDFGISRKIKIGVPMATRQGTLEYMAPEVFESIYDLKADMWSLGVCLFALLFIKFPYERSSILHGHKTQIQYGVDRDFPAKMTEEAADLLAHLLAYDPEMRPTALQAIQHPWLASEAGRFDSIRKRLVSEEGDPTAEGAQILSAVQGFYLSHPITRAICAYTSRYLKPEFRNRFDELFLALTHGRDEILLDQENGQNLWTTVSAAVNDVEGKLIEDADGVVTAPVLSIDWHEFLAAMMLIHCSEDELKRHVTLMLRSSVSTLASGPLERAEGFISRDQVQPLFGPNCGGNATLTLFDEMVTTYGRKRSEDGSVEVDLCALLLADRRRLQKPCGTLEDMPTIVSPSTRSIEQTPLKLHRTSSAGRNQHRTQHRPSDHDTNAITTNHNDHTKAKLPYSSSERCSSTTS